MSAQDTRRIFLADQSDLSDRIQTRLRHKGDDYMPTEYKFCKDCQYHYIMDGGLLPRCARVDQRVDLVTGERVPMFCEAARVGVQCGPDALCFQPKQTTP